MLFNLLMFIRLISLLVTSVDYVEWIFKLRNEDISWENELRLNESLWIGTVTDPIGKW